ncbi:Eco57I restriction-modification methylase domain-containing protein [Granulicella arctica]|uniref:Eco57I restriction-modification methylase domain-containing protein n=1 Tax=Granulicella arctica TaxID=940613 RepID=UPI0021DFB571|nr:N-6 DNA methylase [Granulicella arctica]
MPNDPKFPVPTKILELVERFRDNSAAYKAHTYNETQTRREFLDPFFAELGWNIENKEGYAEAYKDVVHEDAIKIGEATKAPDYSFRIGGTRKFFLEAKKPSVNIKTDTSPAFQLRRYGWTTKLPLSIVSNFEAFAVYDCRVKPDQKDKASVARVMYITYDEYAERWHEIASVFSKEGILKGSFDRYADANKLKRGTADVDDDFLSTIETWRKDLAENIGLRNRNISQRPLNFAVQRIIDRIIFLRICEGRGIEDYGRLRSLADQKNIYTRLVDLFMQADDRYNSGLFHFRAEKSRHEAPDELTPGLILDDKVLKRIFSSLYYPESPYVFSVLPADVLGQVYEQFLGKIISLTSGHKAEINDKPAVKKAGGVYYTPTYVVDFIVESTLGSLLKGKTVKQASKLKVVDPACGSGSFLLGAYEKLLVWHRDAYVNDDPKKWARGSRPTLVEAASGGWKLTIAERKRILIDNVFGVDIDAQAVETTKLSLLLKVLEGETSQTIQPELIYQRALPDLGDNIKCGNSLIASDFYLQYQTALFDEDEQYRINVFDWKPEFPAIFKAGGFDVVIGNPPWGALLSEPELDYLRNKDSEIIVRMIDSFMYFVHQCTAKLNSSGRFGMILPDVLLYQSDNQKLRKVLLDRFTLTHILNMGNVFKKVTRPACILTLSNSASPKPQVRVADLSRLPQVQKQRSMVTGSGMTLLAQKELVELPGALFVTTNIEGYAVWKTVNLVRHEKLISLVDDDGIQRGVSPDLKEAFLVTAAAAKKAGLEISVLRKALTGGRQVKRYFIDHPDLLLIYTQRTTDLQALPKVRAFIDGYRDAITCKEVEKGKHSLYALHRAREERIFLKKKKLIGVITEDEIVLALDEQQTFVTDGLYTFAVVDGVDVRYVMGILNSRLFVFLYRLLALESGRVLAQVKPTLLGQLPIRLLDKAKTKEKAAHDHLVQLVQQRIDLLAKRNIPKTPHEKTTFDRQLTASEEQINVSVDNLYGVKLEDYAMQEALLEDSALTDPMVADA